MQEKYFQLIEYLVHHIHHIPTKELIAISLLLKSKKNLECCVLAVQSLVSILKSDNIFKDVFREVGELLEDVLNIFATTNIFAGMVEVLICLMSLYIDYLGAGAGTSSTQEYQPSMVMIIMIMMMMGLMIIIMAGSPGGDGHHRPD